MNNDHSKLSFGLPFPLMAPYYGPDEDAATIFLERTFIAGDFICGVGYGESKSMNWYPIH